MAAKPILEQDVLREMFTYDPETGFLYRNATDVVPRCNARAPGKRAFTSKTAKGYYRGGLLGRNVMAHRVVWKWHHGTEPEEIDHINGDKSDNRIENLRAATRQDNVRNTCRRKTNKSGVQGVYKCKGSWIAAIRRGGKQVELGYFKDKSDAVACRARAEREAGYHPNHGREPLG